MKKIGIITIPDYNNYGNRLQNFAVKEFFSQMGYSVDTLELNDKEFNQYKKRRMKLLIKKLKLRPLIYLFEYVNGKIQKVKRYKKFEQFTENYLNVRYYPDGNIDALKKTADKYDYILLGSDQIWHPTVMTTPNLFFATFADPEKVLFFSPSFGIEKLPDEYAKKVSLLLSDKENITVREDSGKKIIYELTGKEAVVLPDPTLCISPDTWKSIAADIKKTDSKPYVLKYFLGSETRQYQEEFSKISSKYSAEIFELGSKDNKCGYINGPSEFLGRILNAEHVITDSFHATVFCILFKKPFTVFSRLNEKKENEGLDSRIDSLLEKFGLQNRKFSDKSSNEIGNIDSGNFSSVLEYMKKDTMEYFKKIIEK